MDSTIAGSKTIYYVYWPLDIKGGGLKSH